ncbi:Protein still life, isoform SIF type 1 [Araneus ventricosus]|uniref:Protein still life, isoform SIF type 1 n=1 Tax=Araneus ventricosus TaxID=182803 RepID=A0A4Y2FBT9_ARAVE|nr:Protein still life, isoform SIF type 1 [Araneus ventricosus]
MPRRKTHPQTMTFPPPCFIVEIWFLESKRVPWGRRIHCSETAAKKPLSGATSATEDKLKTPPKPPPKPEPPPKRKSSRGAPVGNKTSSKEATGASTGTSKSSKQTSSKQGKSSTKKKSTAAKKLDVPDRERSPPSDNLLYDNLCYATTPSTSNDNSDVPFLSSDDDEEREEEQEVKPKEKKRAEGKAASFKKGAVPSAANSPTSKLLMEYEMHLRNALARGLDAESYSLHTFEALLTQSMENVVALMREVHVELEEVRKEEQALQAHDEPEGSRAFANARSTTSGPKSSTLPLPGSTRQPPHLAARGDNTPLLPRASVESTDSRIYLTSSEVIVDTGDYALQQHKRKRSSIRWNLIARASVRDVTAAWIAFSVTSPAGGEATRGGSLPLPSPWPPVDAGRSLSSGKISGVCLSVSPVTSRMDPEQMRIITHSSDSNRNADL